QVVQESHDTGQKLAAIITLRFVRKTGADISVDEIVTAALQDRDVVVRREALRAVADCTTSRLVSNLSEILSDPDSGLRIEAGRALVNYSNSSGQEVAHYISAALGKETDTTVRLALISLYGSLEHSDQQSCDGLLQLAKSDPAAS